MTPPEKTKVARVGHDDLPQYAKADGSRGKVHVSSSAPNPTQVNFWIDTSGTYPVAKFWNGSEWEGSAKDSYPHDQPSANTVWVIPHGLGVFPIVQAWDRFGQRLRGGVENVDGYLLKIHFINATAGEALCIRN